jgi:F-type H+-transporting ATPase subunit epsilon
MTITITTPSKTLLDQVCDFVLVHAPTGEFAMLDHHIPIIATVSEGYLKVRQEDNETFVAISGGVVDQKNNVITVIAQSAAIAKTQEAAVVELERMNQELLATNRRMEKEFAFSESELKRSIKASKSGDLL